MTDMGCYPTMEMAVVLACNHCRQVERLKVTPNSEVGRDGALRRLRRQAQRQATERMLPHVIPYTICSARSARAETAQRAVPTGFLTVQLRSSG